MKLSLVLVSSLLLLFGRNDAFVVQRGRVSFNHRPQISSKVNYKKMAKVHPRLVSPPRGERPASSLNAAPAAAIGLLSSPLGSLGILATIVLVHECGHYFAARGFGIRVEEFSIGIGPRLVGFKAFGDEFNLRALPLGGYVRFPENYDAKAAMKQEREAMKAIDDFTREQLQSPSEKVLNALTLGALGDKKIKEENQRRIQQAEQRKNDPWWKRLGGKQVKDLDPLVAPDDLQIEYYDDPQLLQNRPWFERMVVLSGGVIFNFILAFTIFFGIINMGPGLPSPQFSPGTVVTSITSRDAAASGVLRKGDVILGINNRPLTLAERPSVSESQKTINQVVSTIKSTPPGETLKFTVLHANEKTPVEVNITPKQSASGSQSIGVLLSPNFDKTEILKSDSISEAAGMASRYTSTMIQETAYGLASAIGDLVTGRSGSSGSSISGPIGLINQGSQIVASKDWTTVLLFTAALSVNLGVVNAFPIPALDGGQLVFVMFEAVSGRKVNQRVQEGITSATLLFLLLVSAGAAFGDVENIIGRR